MSVILIPLQQTYIIPHTGKFSIFIVGIPGTQLIRQILLQKLAVPVEYPGKLISSSVSLPGLILAVVIAQVQEFVSIIELSRYIEVNTPQP